MAASDADDAGDGGEMSAGNGDQRSDGESQAGSQDVIPPKDRDDAKADDRHQCQFCGEYGPEEGGAASLQVHHIEADPEHCEVHDLENLVTMCKGCHDWLHKKPSADDVPITLTKADEAYLRPHDFEIMRYLYEEGPAMASDVTDALLVDVTEVAVRERLWLLMGLDEMVAGRDEQVLDRDAETGEWGPPEQIAHSDRGRVPGDVQVLMQRIEDEWVRQAIERGCSRETVADVLAVHPRTTYQKEYRAYAHAFPLDALSNGDDVATVIGDSADGTSASGAQPADTDDGVDAAQRRDSGPNGEQRNARTGDEAAGDDEEHSQAQDGGENAMPEDVRNAIEQVIVALEDLRE